MIEIDKTTYSINGFHLEEFDKDLIVLGDTCRKGSKHIDRMLIKDNANSFDWNTYTITREGKIYEHFNPKYYSNHLISDKLNKRAIYILLENMNLLYKIDDIYYNWLYEVCDDENVIVKRWRGEIYWEKYTEKQYESLAYLVKYLKSIFSNIPDYIIESNIYDTDALKQTGILSKSNLFEAFYDLSPVFNFNKLKEMIK